MKWGCCGDVERIASIAASGYDYIESPVRALEVGNPKGSADNLVEQVSKTGLSVEAFNVVIPDPLRLVGPAVAAVTLCIFQTIQFRVICKTMKFFAIRLFMNCNSCINTCL